MGGSIDLAFKEFVRIGFDPYVLMTCAGIFSLLRVLNGRPGISQNSIYRRALPFLDLTFGIAAVFAGSVPMLVDHSPAVKVAVGLWCGFLAQKFHKVLGQTILGDDPRIALKNTSKCSYCSGPLATTDLKCPTCGATTMRALSMPPPPKED